MASVVRSEAIVCHTAFTSNAWPSDEHVFVFDVLRDVYPSGAVVRAESPNAARSLILSHIDVDLFGGEHVRIV